MLVVDDAMCPTDGDNKDNTDEGDNEEYRVMNSVIVLDLLL